MKSQQFNKICKDNSHSYNSAAYHLKMLPTLTHILYKQMKINKVNK